MAAAICALREFTSQATVPVAAKNNSKSEREKRRDKGRDSKDKKDKKEPAPSKAAAAPPPTAKAAASPPPPTPSPAMSKPADPMPAKPMADSAMKPTHDRDMTKSTPAADSAPKPHGSKHDMTPAMTTTDDSASKPKPPDPMPAQPTLSAGTMPQPTSSKKDLTSDTPQKPSTTDAKKAPAMMMPQETRGGLLGFDESLSKRLEIFTMAGKRKTLIQIIGRSTYASSWFIWIFVIMITTQQASLREQLVNLYKGMIWTSIVVLILRMIIRRPRPPGPDGDRRSPFVAAADLYSFSSCALAMLVCRFLAVNYSSDRVVVMTAAIIVLLIVLSSLTMGKSYVLVVVVAWIIVLVVFHILKRTWVPAADCDRYVKRVLDLLHL